MTILVSLTMGTTLKAASAKKKLQPQVTIWAVGEMLMPQDSDFSDLYGNSHFLPKAKLTLHFTPHIHIFAGYSFMKAEGNIQFMDLSFDMECKQSQITFGFGWTSPLSTKFDWYVEAGGFYVKQEENGMDDNMKESLFGFCAETGLVFKLAKALLAQVHAGYSQASKELATGTVKPGGITFGVGLGYRF